ncbi:MAG: ATP-binding cassette domain-containing protein [Beijerinckiaceae bacterium]|nr:ATP-binding cassette domain-containing protein [Beijerinckiaceae bacterium]MCI0735930.1 ATP-binding cassette domain-containing protein [Beijerinckiaceae bacterium]
MELEISISRKSLRTASGQTRVILRDVAFSLRQGEICALLGPSGCGKTTLLRIISGLDSDFEGRVDMPGQQRIGMVFQEPRLLPWRTVAQNLSLASSSSRDELAEIASALRLSKHLDHFPGELSLGLARRVAIARAFAVKPDLLLLDEPFVSLDAALAARMREELLALVLKRRAATLHVTHDVDEAISIADRILVLSPAPGQLLADRQIEAPRQALTQARAAKLKDEILSLMADASS